MSDLTALVAIIFLVAMLTMAVLWSAGVAHELALRIITGIAHGIPLSPRSREGILFHMWLPNQIGTVVMAFFFGLGFLEMVNHVSGAGVKKLAYLAAFLSVCGAAFFFVGASFGLFQYRAKIRRDQQRT
jgi:hypothetical protein